MNIVQQTEQKLKTAIQDAVLKAGLADKETIPAIILEQPKDKAHGDYATNIAMQLARVAKKAPRAIAEDLQNNFDYDKAPVEKDRNCWTRIHQLFHA